MISKELMSEITGIPDNAIESISIGKIIVSVRKINGIVEEYNIYELAHKCKEWATFKNGKNIITERDISGVYSYIIFMIGITIHNEYLDDTTKILANFKADTEPEAIFKACQWILDNK